MAQHPAAALADVDDAAERTPEKDRFDGHVWGYLFNNFDHMI